MTNYYVDSNSGDDGDNGTTQALAWATLEYALESGGLGVGDKVWVRRTHTETPGSDLVPNHSASYESPVETIGWARPAIPNTTITQATWTNGSATVDNIVGITCAIGSHTARYAVAPDGKKYFITQVVDSDTIKIDREYAGPTVSTTNGKFQIEADEDTNPTDIDGWDSDAHTMPIIDFNDANYRLVLDDRGAFSVFKNIMFMDSTDSSGIIGILDENTFTNFMGCIIKQTTIGDPCLVFSDAAIKMTRTVIEGSSTGSGANGITIGGGAIMHLKDVAIYNCGNHGLSVASGIVYLENVNIGVELANDDDDIGSDDQSGMIVFGRDVKLGGNNGDVVIRSGLQTSSSTVKIENHNKILGAHKAWWGGGTFEKVAVSGETPNKKVSDDVIKISPNIANNQPSADFDFNCVEIFCHEFEATTDAKSYKYWLYNDTGDTLNDVTAKDSIWLELEYVDSHDDTSEYTMVKAYSDEIDILDAADADDWDYLEITGITPAVASKVRIRCFCRHYTASGDIFIDPAVVVS